MKKEIATWAAGIGFCLTGCWDSCVARGARVSTPNGERPIEDLQVADRVFCVDTATGEKVVTRVTFIKQATREVGSITLHDVKTRMTPDHPVYDPESGEYHPAGDWFTGTRNALLVMRGSGAITTMADAVSMYDGVSDVFDISVESEHHNFIADGIVVHNKELLPQCNTPDGTRVYHLAACGGDGCLGFYDCVSQSVAVCKCSPVVAVDAGDTSIDVSSDVSLQDAADTSSSDVVEDVSSDTGQDSDPGQDTGE